MGGQFKEVFLFNPKILFHFLFQEGDVSADVEGFVAQRIVLLEELVGFEGFAVVAHNLVGHAFLDEEHRRGEVVGVLTSGLGIVGNGVLVVAELHVAVADSTKGHGGENLVVARVFLQVLDGVLVVA